MIPFTLGNACRTTVFVWAVAYLFFASGCTQDPAALALPEINIETPNQIQVNGTTWAKADIGVADHDCLARFFQVNQQLVGSPDMEGTPMLFTSGKNDRRFYWLNPAADGIRWTCVHFEKRRFATSDGNGSPF